MGSARIFSLEPRLNIRNFLNTKIAIFSAGNSEFSRISNAKIAKSGPKISANLSAQLGIDTGHNLCEQEMKSYRAIFDISHTF